MRTIFCAPKSLSLRLQNPLIAPPNNLMIFCAPKDVSLRPQINLIFCAPKVVCQSTNSAVNYQSVQTGTCAYNMCRWMYMDVYEAGIQSTGIQPDQTDVKKAGR